MAQQAEFADSNIASYGGDGHRDLRKAAAESEAEWKGAGEAPGIEIWRIENFGVKRWDSKMTGTFFTGDSYIVLHTYKKPDSPKFYYNVHFWLGEESTQDERGTAAYKTVELDDLLGDLPVQYREVQGHETKDFLDLFGGNIKLLSGGVDGAFHKVTPETYQPRLLHFKGKSSIRVQEVPLQRSSLNKGDVFLLDAGLTLIQWNGPQSSGWERSKASEIVSRLKADRNGRPTARVLDGMEDDELFWETLGGKGPVAEAVPDQKEEAYTPKLLRVSDASGHVQVTEEAQGNAMLLSKLDPNDVFIVDVGVHIYVWIGSRATKQERKAGIKNATEYLTQTNRPLHTPIQRVMQDAEPDSFKKVFADGKKRTFTTGPSESKNVVRIEGKQGQLAKGCYLTWREASQGSLFLNWKETAPEGALAYFSPGKSVPKFKFTVKSGEEELTRYTNTTIANLYEGWTNFIKMARDYKSQFVFLKPAVGIYFTQASKLVRLQPNEWVNLDNYEAVTVCSSSNAVFDNVQNIERSMFISKGANAGAARTF